MYRDIYQVVKRLEKEFGFKFKKSNYVIYKKEEKIVDSIIFRKHIYKDKCKFIFVIFTNWHHMEPEKSRIHCELEIIETCGTSHWYEQLDSIVDLERFIKMTKYEYFYYYKMIHKINKKSYIRKSRAKKILDFERHLNKVKEQLKKNPNDASLLLMIDSLKHLLSLIKKGAWT